MKKAKSHFQKFHLEYIPLMREDLIASACELEYADCLLLDNKNWKSVTGEVIKCIEKAYKFAGKELDVIQQCAFLYLRINEINRAEPLFRRLINEDYNKVLNAQLLSKILVERKDRSNYDLLAVRIDPKYLIPFEDTTENIFIDNQKEILIRKIDLIFEQVSGKYEARFNKTVPLLLNREYPDSLFMKDAQRDRLLLIEDTFVTPKKSDEYLALLNSSPFMYDCFIVLNELVKSSALLGIGDMETFSDSIRKELENKKNVVLDMQKKITKENLIKYITDFNYNQITQAFFSNFSESVKQQCRNKENMSELIMLESSLRDWCLREKIAEPELLFEGALSNAADSAQRDFINPAKIFGNNFEIYKRDKELKEKLKEIAKQYADGICTIKNAELKLSDVDLDAYFSDKNNPVEAMMRSKVIAVLDVPNGIFSLYDNDLYFTTEGVYLKKFKRIIAYNSNEKNQEIQIDNDMLSFGDKKYNINGVDNKKLYRFINALAKKLAEYVGNK